MNLEQINELTRIAYDKTAEKYHNQFKDEVAQKEFDRLILDKFSFLFDNHSTICDAGCGPSGHIGKYLADKGYRIIGIDISQSCIDIATTYNPQIVFRTMDMAETDFANDFFDGIISYYSIIHTPKQFIHRIFAEFNRIIRQDGYLLVVVKKGTVEGFTEDDWYEGNQIYFTCFVENEIKAYFEANGFRLDYLHTRKPYEFEIDTERIYAIGTKVLGVN